MKKVDVLRAWKDAEYRQSLTADQISALPTNPAGELTDMEQNNIAGGGRTIPAPATECSEMPHLCRIF
jgi:mersacidin/lichenicidin family type 2 lantibiotic